MSQNTQEVCHPVVVVSVLVCVSSHLRPYDGVVADVVGGPQLDAAQAGHRQDDVPLGAADVERVSEARTLGVHVRPERDGA